MMDNTNIMSLTNEKFLSQGAANQIYIATLDGREVVVKKAKHPEWSKLDKEYNILRYIGGGLTPEVYGFIKEPDRLMLAEEYIKGVHPEGEDENFTINLARQLSEFHEKCKDIKIADVPEYTVSIFLRDNINTPFKRFSSVFPERIKKSIENLIKRISEEIEKNSHIFEGVPSTLVHTDLIRWNILCEESGKVRVIDWENGRMDCAECDIATFFRGFCVSEYTRKIFLDNYTYEINLDRLRLCEALHYLQVAIWWTDSHSGFDATDEIISKVDADIDGAERFLAG